jgi:flagellar hook-basal body complex protein FliE
MDFSAAMSKVLPGTFVPDIGTGTDTPNITEIPGAQPAVQPGDASQTSFKDTVKQMLADVNDKMTDAAANSRDLASGKTNDLNKVVTSAEEASLAFSYTMAIRTKLLDAYTEISRITV